MVLLRVVASLSFAVCCLCPKIPKLRSGTVTGSRHLAVTMARTHSRCGPLQPGVDIAPPHPKLEIIARQHSAAVNATLRWPVSKSTMSHGKILVFVEKLAIFPPFAQLSREDSTTEARRTPISFAKLLTPVSVAAQRIHTVEVRHLQRLGHSGAIRLMPVRRPTIITGVR